MARPVSVFDLTPADKLQLQDLARSKSASESDALRACIVLRRAEGCNEADVAKALNVSLTTVSIWSRRFERHGLKGLLNRPGRGRKAWLPIDKVRQSIAGLAHPPKGKKKWSTRGMAAALGLSHQSVYRIWRRNGLKPHLVCTSEALRDKCKHVRKLG